MMCREEIILHLCNKLLQILNIGGCLQKSNESSQTGSHPAECTSQGHVKVYNICCLTFSLLNPLTFLYNLFYYPNKAFALSHCKSDQSLAMASKNSADKHFEKDQSDHERGNEHGLGFARLQLEFPVKMQAEQSSVTGGIFYSAGGETRQG